MRMIMTGIVPGSRVYPWRMKQEAAEKGKNREGQQE
jgi:hypothetical protein